MPLAWVHDLPKQQAEELASQLGLPTDGTLDDLRKRIKEKWTTIEAFLPSQSTAKSTLVTKSSSQVTDSVVHDSSHLSKMKIRLVTDLIKNIPLLADTDPERILKFLICVKGVHELNLVTDFEFISLLVSRTSGRITQILGSHLGTTQNWGMVRSEIISTFLPPRVKERFLASYVMDRFQSSSENLNSYIMSVVAAADILGYEGPESQLVHRMLQNIHPPVKSYFLFANKPESVRDLFSLATTVAEAVATEEQRKLLTSAAQQGGGTRPVAKSMVVAKSSATVANRRVRCWGCGAWGHIQRDCSSKSQSSRNPADSGNAPGARQ
jgi:hypothetical protein